MIDEYGVLKYIIDYKRQHDGNSPSVREIANACKFRSTSAVALRLARLEAEGLISRNNNRSLIEVAGGRWVPPREREI